MKVISLTQGKVTLVDDDVYEWASKFKWCASKHKSGFYAVRSYRDPLTKKDRTIYLHREIAKPGKGLEIDHRDNDGLNNRRENFRIATSRQNTIAAARVRANKSSKFRGVTRSKSALKWRASLRSNDVFIHLGFFEVEEDAARAYDFAAPKYFGEFAQLNFPSTKTI